MTFIKENAGWIALVILAIMGISGWLYGSHSQSFGSTSCSNITCLSGGLRLVSDTGGDFESDVAAIFSSTVKIGTSGTALNTMIAGTCTLIAPSFTVAASTTVSMDCAVTGAMSGDKVFAMFATSTSAGNGWAITQASASSTAGYDTFRVTNNTGASATIPGSIGSTTQYMNIR